MYVAVQFAINVMDPVTHKTTIALYCGMTRTEQAVVAAGEATPFGRIRHAHDGRVGRAGQVLRADVDVVVNADGFLTVNPGALLPFV